MANDYTSALLQALSALAITAGLAYLFLRFLAARAPFGRVSGLDKIQIEERLRIDPKSSLLIVRIEDRRILLATNAESAARLIVELKPLRPEPGAES